MVTVAADVLDSVVKLRQAYDSVMQSIAVAQGRYADAEARLTATLNEASAALGQSIGSVEELVAQVTEAETVLESDGRALAQQLVGVRDEIKGVINDNGQ